MPTPAQRTRLTVEVVAVANGLNFRKPMMVPQGQTLGWAVNASGVLALHPHLQGAAVGVWGKILPPETLVEEGDRIEVYAPVRAEAAAEHRARLRAAPKDAKVQA